MLQIVQKKMLCRINIKENLMNFRFSLSSYLFYSAPCSLLPPHWSSTDNTLTGLYTCLSLISLRISSGVFPLASITRALVEVS